MPTTVRIIEKSLECVGHGLEHSLYLLVATATDVTTQPRSSAPRSARGRGQWHFQYRVIVKL